MDIGRGSAPRAGCDVLVVLLDDAEASDPLVSGAKAANLAVARKHGLTTLPGFAVTTAAHDLILDGTNKAAELPPKVMNALREPWELLSVGGSTPLVVRSSSTIEDVGESSMAGQFTSVLDVRGWDAFAEALLSVFASAGTTPGAQGAADEPLPMAVLVQPMLEASSGGVMFGVDPVTGERDAIVIEAVAGGPDDLVSGRSTAQRYVVNARGGLETIDSVPLRHWPRHAPEMLLARRQIKALHTLATDAASTYGGPQDIEWAFGADGQLWLLQSRPVTAVASTGVGAVLGAGPVAETFPDPLRPLEQDLWLLPLREGVVAALGASGARPARLLDPELVRTVGGRVVVDLEAFGYVRRRGSLSWIDPRPSLHRLGVAWRVGRLRADLADRAQERARLTDSWLAQIPRLPDSDDERLLHLLHEARDHLADLHRDEVLVGTLSMSASRSAASLALMELARGKALGMNDDEVIARAPIVLSLVAPRISPRTRLPSWTHGHRDLGEVPDQALSPREALRLRARWVQELQVRAAAELGARLHARDALASLDEVALLSLDELASACRTGAVPGDLEARATHAKEQASYPPLPSEFRLTAEGSVVPAARRGVRPSGGVGAGGGRGAGQVVHAGGQVLPAPGDVLVVRDLSPALAPLLPSLAGIVSESGSTLSHLAILAREYGVPTVVGAHDALRRFPIGARLLVDGGTGELKVLDEVES